jgi:hypothetical protein
MAAWHEQVDRCGHCPFMETVGDCEANVCNAFPAPRFAPARHIPDEHMVHDRPPPSWCPLRTGPLTVMLAASVAPHPTAGTGEAPDPTPGRVG